MISICVCGAGTMGSGIAQIFAQHGFYTVLYDLQPAMLQKAQQSIQQNLQGLVNKSRLSTDAASATLERLRFTANINDCIADVCIEAVIEKLPAKIALFNQLNELNHGETIFASNTSSLSINAIANAVPNPGRVAGLHFFNPAQLMKLVEIVAAEATTAATITRLTDLVKALQKTPVLCKDAPGFIVNRVARPYYIEALRLLEAGIPAADIDDAMEAIGFKMGPFRLMDLIGNDINYAVSESVYEALGRPPRLKPSYLQKEKVESGELGRKSGKGFYRY